MGAVAHAVDALRLLTALIGQLRSMETAVDFLDSGLFVLLILSKAYGH
jgi:hypothetical protein